MVINYLQNSVTNPSLYTQHSRWINLLSSLMAYKFEPPPISYLQNHSKGTKPFKIIKTRQQKQHFHLPPKSLSFKIFLSNINQKAGVLANSSNSTTKHKIDIIYFQNELPLTPICSEIRLWNKNDPFSHKPADYEHRSIWVLAKTNYALNI